MRAEFIFGGDTWRLYICCPHCDRLNVVWDSLPYNMFQTSSCWNCHPYLAPTWDTP